MTTTTAGSGRTHPGRSARAHSPCCWPEHIPASTSDSARRHTSTGNALAPWVAFACYAAAAASLLVSTNTSWRFFDRVLHIPTHYGERYLMFAVAEVALVVCGAGMAVNVHRDGRPGSFRVMVWAMVIAMGYMAWAMSTPEEAIGRILLGPALGTIMLHLGLGLELRARHHRTGTIARIGRELRERCLSRLGLADDGRDAAQRTRDRKACKAAALSRPRRLPWSRQARLEHALLAAGVADDPAMRDRMLARLAVVRHADALSTLTPPPSPWQQADSDVGPGHSPPSNPTARHTTRTARGRRTCAAHIAAAPLKRSRPHDQRLRDDVRRRRAGWARSDVGPKRRAASAHIDCRAQLRGVAQREQAAAHGAPRGTLARNQVQGDDAARRATPSRDIDPAAIQHWLPVATTIVGDGVTRGRMRRWPEEQHPEVVATVLADHAAGTPPSTIGRRRDVHHQTVGKILEAAGALTG